MRETFRDLGERSLKNIDRPVRVYASKTDRAIVAGGVAFARANFTPRAGRETRHCGAAVREHERRPGAGLFLRRHQRGHHHGAVEAALVLRHRAQFLVHLQAQDRSSEADGRGTRRRLCGRGQRTQGGRPRAHHRPAQRRRDRRADLGGALRPQPRRCVRRAGRDHRGGRRRDRAATLRRGKLPRVGANRPRASTRGNSSCAPCRITGA